MARKRCKANADYEVIVGNIGTVFHGKDCDKAHDTYHEYVKISKKGRGRVGGESVTLMENCYPIAEHHGKWEDF